MDSETPLNYRDTLANKLSSIPDRKERETTLKEAKKSLAYKVASAIKAFNRTADAKITSSVRESQRPFQKEIKYQFDNYNVSNEPYLYKLFPLIRERKGAVMSLGMDQGLDCLVNSQCSVLYAVDVTQSTTLIRNALLETGVIHKKLFGRYPSPSELIDYFRDENTEALREILKLSFNSDEIKISNQT